MGLLLKSLLILSIVGTTMAACCYKYGRYYYSTRYYYRYYGGGGYYYCNYCPGYCTGSYGRQTCHQYYSYHRYNYNVYNVRHYHYYTTSINKSSLSTGGIVGIILGSIAFAVFTGMACRCITKHGKSNSVKEIAIMNEAPNQRTNRQSRGRPSAPPPPYSVTLPGTVS